MSVALFFMYRQFGGGTTSYTVHLYEGMRRAGLNPKIYRVKERGEHFERPFSKYEGVKYRNITPEEGLEIARTTPSLMTAPCNSKYLDFDPEIIGKLMKAGMRVTIHDPNEFQIYDHLDNIDKMRAPFCIRPTMKRFFPNAIMIPHPYVREYDRREYEPDKRKYHAVSVARVTFVKRTDMILEANRKLPKKLKIVLRGAENRLYTKHVITPMFPEYVQGQVGFPMTWGASARECANGKLAVDMTWFPEDGGGSQYSFMEAWDAGTVNIIAKDWLRYKGEMLDGVNCIAVEDSDEMAKKVRDLADADVSDMVNAGYKALEAHDPVKVARRYYKELVK